ncbi:MAG: menaquinone biosynthesis decarboxylase, partial [Alistipes sp.]|nr:menaquinone biosynthesis decarboxylase [Alistipes sp.]
MYKNLREYIERLEREGELVRIKSPVSTRFEIAEITDRVVKSEGGGKALLFENTDTEFPVLTNMMGSTRRIAMALGVESLDEIGGRISALLGDALSPKATLWDKMRMLPLLADVAKWFPKNESGRGECQQVVWSGDEVDLERLPLLHSWECDGGAFVTLPMVNTIDPETGMRNVGMYRMQRFDKRTTGMHWHIHKTGARHYDAYKRLGRKMPVVVALGGDPAYTYAATAPMPDNMDEYLLAGFLRQKPVRLVKAITCDIRIPSDCDFVIEGYVDPAEEKTIEGDFGDHTGFYSLKDYYPKFHVTCITHRRDAIYPATVVGVPPQEDAYISQATEKIFLAPIRLAVQPEVEDLYMPVEGTSHNIAIVSIAKRYEGQAHKVAQSLWGAGQMMFNKYLLRASAGTNIRSFKQLGQLMRRLNVERDVIRGEGVLDVLDHATATCGFGGKLAFDFTSIDADSEVKPFEVPRMAEPYGGVAMFDSRFVEEYGLLLLFAERERPVEVDVEGYLKHNNIKGVKFVALFDGQA